MVQVCAYPLTMHSMVTEMATIAYRQLGSLAWNMTGGFALSLQAGSYRIDDGQPFLQLQHDGFDQPEREKGSNEVSKIANEVVI